VRQQQLVKGRLEAVETQHLLGREILVETDVLVMAGFEHAIVITNAVVMKVDVSPESQIGLYRSLGSGQTYRCSTGASAVAI
jgi:hypothetical protein